MEKKRKRGKWDPQSLLTALDKVLAKEMSLTAAALHYDIPKSTLHDKICAVKRGKEVTLEPTMGRFRNTFSTEYEQNLVDHIKDLSNRCLPLTKKDFLKLAFDLAEALKIPHRFNKEKQAAGKHFYYDFIQRHPNISFRASKSTCRMQAMDSNSLQVNIFYENLEKLMTECRFPPANIYNCDATGVSCLGPAGKLTSADKAKNITVLFCMSADGHFIPPFFIFPRQRMNDRLMINAPAQSIGVAQPNARMNSDLFLQWLQLFATHSHPSKETPVLLILDGHSSHKTLAVINFCRENNIHLISFPPNTTHKLQPFDRTFWKPFTDAYNQKCDIWIEENAGSRITDYDIAALVNDAYTQVARTDIAVSGFKCTGMYPFDRHLFTDIDDLAADMTDITVEEFGTSFNSSSGCEDDTPNDIH